ncbi:HNH endonuclease [Bacillus thuringiensis]|uniref:HNH endonuclease n=1 Tax=Bacillus thuringiensis TaxID=1428 RepID=A0A9X7BLB3_BACTU|nr:HNH endonuclease signature motif containing protein [Bacillus thuringiensis]PFV28034.1 HNH endonuclease [Bacillus thuringiensis]
MGVSSDVVRKLWALSGNRCAICKTSLLQKGKTNIGEVCHIVAKKKKGMRGDHRLDLNKRDEYSNLILLCANHHTEIDAKGNDYSVERLHKIKSNHEDEIESRLAGEFLEEIEIDDNLLENQLDSINRVTEWDLSKEQLEKCIEEYFALDEKEQKVLHALINTYLVDKDLDVPKVAKRIKDDLSILESLRDLQFLHYYNDENLLTHDENMCIIDLNDEIRVSAFRKYNWVLGVYGEIMYQVYLLMGEKKKFKDFNSEIRLEFLDFSD